MSKIYFYPDINYQEIKNIEKSCTSNNEMLLINKVADIIFERIIGLVDKKEPILFICGPGNNGKDALFAAKKLSLQSYNVDVFITEKSIKNINKNDYNECNYIDNLKNISCYKFIIDGIFGYGLNRILDEKYINLIKLINSSSAYIISIDIPSGLNHDTGTPMPIAIQSNLLISLLNIKRGIFTHQGRDTWSEISHHNLVDYDSPTQNYLITANHKLFKNSPKYILKKIYKKELNSQHKKSNGISCIVAGQQPYHGALILASKGAIDTGNRYMHVFTETEYSYTLPLHIPEIIANSFSIEEFRKAIATYKQILIGPGTTTIGREYVKTALENINYFDSVIVDAGALQYIDKNKSYSDKLIITPHPGEAAKLLGIEVSEVQNDRYKAIKSLYDIFKCIIVLKGSGSIIFDGKNLYTCMDGNHKMASAGAGDILAGIILSETSFHDSNIDACIKSVTYHSYSSDILYKESKNENFRPSMIPEKYSELINNDN